MSWRDRPSFEARELRVQFALQWIGQHKHNAEADAGQGRDEVLRSDRSLVSRMRQKPESLKRCLLPTTPALKAQSAHVVSRSEDVS